MVGLHVGQHKVLVEWVDANDETLDGAIVNFFVPKQFPDPRRNSGR
ncbi:hypothetical protein [Paraburkholderia azotifigens]